MIFIRSNLSITNGIRFSRLVTRGHGRFQFQNNNHFVGSASLVRFISSDRKKIEDIIRTLKADVKTQMRQIKEDAKKEKQLAQKSSLPTRMVNKLMEPKQLLRDFWHELVHYYHGFRLFFLDVKLCTKYIWKLRREPLRRRERKQLVRTFTDLLRIFPFAVFIVVPFMELLLPFYIKFFPKMMPSTFHSASEQEKEHLKHLKGKIETAKLLQETMEEIALTKKNRSDHEHIDENTSRAYEFSQFLRKVRTEDEGYVSNSELFKFIKLFEDELTLDNLNIVQLRALCRLLGISKLGNIEFLRFRLDKKLQELKADDKLIAAEGGVDVLSVQELQAACRARGMRAAGLSEERLKNQLKQWLELSLNDQVPPSLLLLSRAMYFPEELTFVARLRSIIAQLPEEIGEFTTLKLKELEGIDDPKERMEVIRSIEEALEHEEEINSKQTNTDTGTIFIESELDKAETTVDQLNEIITKAQSQHESIVSGSSSSELEEAKSTVDQLNVIITRAQTQRESIVSADKKAEVMEEYQTKAEKGAGTIISDIEIEKAKTIKEQLDEIVEAAESTTAGQETEQEVQQTMPPPDTLNDVIEKEIVAAAAISSENGKEKQNEKRAS